MMSQKFFRSFDKAFTVYESLPKLFCPSRHFHFYSNTNSYIKPSAFRVLNPAEKIKSLPVLSYPYASLLSTPTAICNYTNRALPTGLMLRFVKSRDEISCKIWLVSDQIVGPKKNGKGIWLTCRYSVVKNFVKERCYRVIGEKLVLRTDLADHIITLFSIRIYQQLKKLLEDDLISFEVLKKKSRSLKTPESNFIQPDSFTSGKLANNNIGCFLLLKLTSTETPVLEGKSSPDCNSQTWLESSTPTYQLDSLVEGDIYTAILKLRQIQRHIVQLPKTLSPGQENCSFLKLGLKITLDTVPFMNTLFRASAYGRD